MRNRLYLPTLFAVVLLKFAVLSAAAREMSVQVRSGQVRATPSFLGAPTGEVEYGTRVKVVTEQGAWSKVIAPGIGEGWMHNSALTRKRVVLLSGEKDVEIAASGEELALAGKGFNAEVEEAFKAENQNVDFAWVDKMEKWEHSDKDLADFLRTGAITPSGGGR